MSIVIALVVGGQCTIMTANFAPYRGQVGYDGASTWFQAGDLNCTPCHKSGQHLLTRNKWQGEATDASQQDKTQKRTVGHRRWQVADRDAADRWQHSPHCEQVTRTITHFSSLFLSPYRKDSIAFTSNVRFELVCKKRSKSE